MNIENTADSQPDTPETVRTALQGGRGLTAITVTGPATVAEIGPQLLSALNDRPCIARLTQPRQGLLAFLHGACEAFGVPVPPEDHSVATFLATLRGFLDAHQADRPLLLVEEAQDAPFYIWWQLMALCQPSDGDGALQVVMLGNPAMGALLQRPEMAPVANDLNAHFFLTAWAPAPEPLRQPEAIPNPPPAPAPAPARPTLPPAAAPRPPRLGLWLAAAGLAGAMAAMVFWQPGPDSGTPPPPAPPAPASANAPTAPPVAIATPEPTPPAPAPAVVAAAPTPEVAPAPVPAVPAAPPSPLDTLVDDAASTWGVLASRWNASVSGDNPCDELLRQQLQCYRRPDMTLDMLRQFDRPGLVQLKAEQAVRWVHLQSMDAKQVTLFSSGKTWTLATKDFARQWSGAYSTLWRLPPGQVGKVFTALPDSPAGQWLDQQLRQLQASGQLGPSDDSLTARVTALQRAQGWPADGKALPTVLLLVNRLANVPEPRLLEAPGAPAGR